MVSLTSKDNRSYWIWVSKFLFGDPTCGLNNNPQHFGEKSPNLFRKTSHIPLRERESPHRQSCKRHRCVGEEWIPEGRLSHESDMKHTSKP